jgi:hypothetical protein
MYFHIFQVMIYLIEGVLPESYFANNLRGLSVDMAVFRDLLRLRMPTLSRHLEQLQHDARDSATGKTYILVRKRCRLCHRRNVRERNSGCKEISFYLFGGKEDNH